MIDCLIQLYDHERMNNMIDILALQPQKTVFLYDPHEVDRSAVNDIQKACKNKLPHMEFQAVTVNKSSLDEVRLACKTVIRQNPSCLVDITGGGEFGAIGAYIACIETFTPIFKVDAENAVLINAYGCKSMETSFRMPKLSIDTLLEVHGAALAGYGHPKPQPELFDKLLAYCKAVFQNIPAWKDLCYYLQTGSTAFSVPGNTMQFNAPVNLSGMGGKAVLSDTTLLKLANELGLIKNLALRKNFVSLQFLNDTVKKYMTDFGTWLELYSYITLCKTKKYDDVRLSVKVDWNGMRQTPVEVTNEIDVTFFSGMHPVFVSCKLSEPSSEALHELSVYSSYFGGRQSRCILVTLADIDRERSHIVWRAKEMGITVIDGNTIKKGNFLSAVEQACNFKKPSER